MGDLFSLVGKISVEYSDALEKIETVSNTADEAAESLDEMDKSAEESQKSVEGSGEAAAGASGKFSKWEMVLANLASGAIQRIIDKTIELAQKIGELTVKAVGNYADYEQLVGGVETLFKDSSDELLGYAENAYKTAGLSANNYMETATSFAASLIQGLGGDTAKAVKLTDLAITDMSDNANKMGTDIASIQTAYQGFAKQNYTMLDNLKLGYGGTQEEMVRLINDSGILENKIKDLDGITFDQIIQAIHNIQDNLGITGTTAKEAGDTISGSWSSVQALFENILTKVGSQLAPVVMGFLQQLSSWMETVDWDAFSEKVGNAFGGLLDWIQQIDFTTFFETGLNGVLNFVEGLGGLIDKVVSVLDNFTSFMDILTALSPVIAGVTAALVAFKVAMAISSLINGVVTAFNAYKAANEGATIAQWLLNAAIHANPIMLIVTLIAGLIAAVITLWNTNENFRNAVIAVWEAIKSAFGTAIEAIKGFFSGLVEGVSAAWDTICNAIQVAIMFIGEILSAAVQIIALPFTFIWENCKEIITAAWEAIKGFVSSALEAISSTISSIWNAIVGFLSQILDGIKTKFTTIFNAIKSTITTIFNSIKSTVSTVMNAIKTAITSSIEAAKNTVSNLLNGIKTTFSTVFNGIKSFLSPVVDWLKGIFNFNWSLPKIKLPHFKISGSFSLNPPSVPHFGIEWYKKAMDEGMNQPTIFGYNPKSNRFLAGGEAGSETVVGTESLKEMIRNAVASENDYLAIRLDRIITLLTQFFSDYAYTEHKTVLSVNGRELSEAIVTDMDKELGKLWYRKDRGR